MVLDCFFLLQKNIEWKSVFYFKCFLIKVTSIQRNDDRRRAFGKMVEGGNHINIWIYKKSKFLYYLPENSTVCYLLNDDIRLMLAQHKHIRLLLSAWGTKATAWLSYFLWIKIRKQQRKMSLFIFTNYKVYEDDKMLIWFHLLLKGLSISKDDILHLQQYYQYYEWLKNMKKKK